MEHSISFEAGMNGDLNKSIVQKNQYLSASNIRLTTQNGQSSFAIENLKGNTLSFSFPTSLPPIYKIKIIGTGNVNISINTIGTGKLVSVILGSSIGLDLYNSLNSLVGFNSTFFVAYNEDYIVLYSTIFDVAPVVSDQSKLQLSTIVSTQHDLQPIGYTNLRDDIYIYTTSSLNSFPNTSDSIGTPTSGVSSNAGQIWKFTYDKVTFSTNIELLYNNLLNFSTYNGIPPTATRGRYENLNIQRIYWTDNFNSLRQLNVVSTNIAALDPSILNINTSTNLDVPILQNIDSTLGGTLKVGVWQMSYRLYNAEGDLSSFSELSDLVPVTTSSETRNYKDYLGDGSGITSSKSITWQINGLDTDFNRIEAISIYKSTKDGLPIIKKFLDETIPTSGSISITLFGNETTTDITLDELNLYNNTFDICKTIADKDNILFVANVKSRSNDINFDSRAYSYTQNSLTVILKNNGVNSIALNQGDLINLPEIYDAINIDRSIYKYKFNSNKLGGTGPNINYEFGTISTIADSILDQTLNTKPGYISGNIFHPNKNFNRANFNLGVPTHTYITDNCSFDGLKNPYEMFLLRGYHRGEIYRFAIQLYNKQGKPTFTKWIADIKIPDYFDTNDNPDTTFQGYPTDFRNSWVGLPHPSSGLRDLYSQQLYIKFNVDVSSIVDQISGWRIVRVQRTDTDKSILGQGLLFDSSMQDMTGNVLHNPTYNDTGGRSDDYLNTDPTKVFVIIKTFNSSDFLQRGTPIRQNGDSLRLISKMAPPSGQGYESVWGANSSGTEQFRFVRYYDWNNPGNIVPSVIADTKLLSGNNTYGFQSGYTFINDSVSDYGPDRQDGIGGNTCFIRFDQTATLPPSLFNSPYKWLCNYQRNITNQYGGNTYSERTNNLYIAASEFVPINSQNSSEFTISCFGGDTFVGVFDCQKIFKTWGRVINEAEDNISFTVFCVMESSVNPEFRYSNTNSLSVNTGGFPDNGTGIDIFEDFGTNLVFSTENNIRTYFPKPLNFIPNNEFDNRVYFSGIKINGELRDSWSSFKTNDYWDVEGTYGPINLLDSLENQIIFFQDRSFGRLLINPITAIASTTSQIILGKGDTIQKHEYVSTKVGCKHQWATCKSEHIYYWFDIINKKLYKYNLGSIEKSFSDEHYEYSYLQNNLSFNINKYDKPLYNDNLLGGIKRNGIIAVYDRKYDEAIFTFHDGNENIQNSFTLCFNERADNFSSFYSFTPFIYITDDSYIFSPNILNTTTYKNVYIHNRGNYGKFYEITYPSTIKLLINPYPKETKVLDNISYISEAIDYSGNNPVNKNDETWKIIRIYNDFQNTNFQFLTVNNNIKRKERSWNLAVPRNKVLYTNSNSPDIFTDLSINDKTFGERIRDKYFIIDLSYDNISNNSLVTHNLTTFFRKSDR